MGWGGNNIFQTYVESPLALRPWGFYTLRFSTEEQRVSFIENNKDAAWRSADHGGLENAVRCTTPNIIDPATGMRRTGEPGFWLNCAVLKEQDETFKASVRACDISEHYLPGRLPWGTVTAPVALTLGGT